MFKKKRKLFFENKTCNVCGKKAEMFRCIEGRTYILCLNRRCSFIIKVRHGWHEPLVK